jgi:hypothetical protein
MRLNVTKGQRRADGTFVVKGGAARTVRQCAALLPRFAESVIEDATTHVSAAPACPAVALLSLQNPASSRSKSRYPLFLNRAIS